MTVFSYELLYDGELHSRGAVDSACESAYDFFLGLSARPYPKRRVHIRVWVGASMAGHPEVDQPRRRVRSLSGVTS